MKARAASAARVAFQGSLWTVRARSASFVTFLTAKRGIPIQAQSEIDRGGHGNDFAARLARLAVGCVCRPVADGRIPVIIAGIRRATVHPNPFSWLIWSLVASLAAAGSWRAGATWPLGGALANALGCMAVLVVTLGRGGFVANRVDLSCLAVAAAGIRRVELDERPSNWSGAVPGGRRCGRRPDHPHGGAGWALRERYGVGPTGLGGVAAVCSVEPIQWAWTWAGFGQWGGAVYVAAVNALVTATIHARPRHPSVRQTTGDRCHVGMTVRPREARRIKPPTPAVRCGWPPARRPARARTPGPRSAGCARATRGRPVPAPRVWPARP